MLMDTSPQRRRIILMLSLTLALALTGTAAYFLWPRPPALPQPGSPRYVEYVHTFQVGVAALDSGMRPELALPKLTHAIDLIPDEPAGWANRGLLHLRNNNLTEADKDQIMGKSILARLRWS